MYDENRGKIKYPDRYKQLISYEGLERHRHITPTDLDGIIDYRGNAFIIIECKLEYKEIDLGQKMAIENLINSLSEAGKMAICYIIRHNLPSEKIIIAKDCLVSDSYFQGKWRYYTDRKTLLNYIISFEKFCKINNIYI
jgi:hypothetical protein